MLRWPTLKKTQDLKLFKSMYIWLIIVPIAAKTLKNIKDVLSINIFSEVFTIHVGLPFSWQIFYFSAIAISISNIVYHLFCPSIIKDNTSYAHFTQEGKGISHLADYDNQFKINSKGLQNHLLMGRFKKVTDDEEAMKHIFWEIYEESSTKRERSRQACALFLGLGFILISIVVIQNMMWVINAIINA